jgi:hypothetical protein
VFDEAKQRFQPDIANLAAFRGRKMILLQQNQEAGVQQTLEAQEQRAANDLAKQHGNYANGPGF